MSRSGSRRLWAGIASLAVIAAAGAAGLSRLDGESPPRPIRAHSQDASLPEATVYKSPSCLCCGRWVDHLRAAGFAVTAVDTEDMSAVKARHGLGAELASCHTAIVDGYVIEGHVPADLIVRLLDERPAIAGLAVPGMPMGSPGMEGPREDRYEVLAFDRNGATRVYARR